MRDTVSAGSGIDHKESKHKDRVALDRRATGQGQVK
jgi:hypothetical protein